MNKSRFNLIMALSLVLSSVLVFSIQFILFHDTSTTLFYLLQDMAFAPLQVLIVTLILERILSLREKREMIRKLNVVISAFFSEVGIQGINEMNCFVRNIKELQDVLNVNTSWTEEDFKAAAKKVAVIEYEIESQYGEIENLKSFLMSKRAFILTMFENTNLLEHDTFTDMLWAIFHISDELESRESLRGLPETDLEHLSIDIKRAYRMLIIEWLYYMDHLKKEYPYLFSLAIRKSPFGENQSVIIR